MDLTSFTNPKKKEEEKTLVKDNNLEISKIGNKAKFNLKNKTELEKYEKFLFFSPTNAIKPKSKEELDNFFQKSIEDNVEGLMVKSLKAKYTPGNRTGSMTKLKQTKEDIDVVILAAEHGTGKRAGFYSSFYVAVQNPHDENEPYLTVGKVSSGIKELEDSLEGISMQKITSLLKPLKIREEKGVVYFEPKIVIQVRYQEIQRSVAYNSGFALRFPRIITLREDKLLEEINSIDDIVRFSE
ncbi:MAG: hypothetical protein ACOCXG_04855 [Nanoarchaeota archaeon]